MGAAERSAALFLFAGREQPYPACRAIAQGLAMIRSIADRALALLLLTGLASPAVAAGSQSGGPTRAPAVQTVMECRKIEEAAGRLACYDRSVDAMARAETSGDLVTLDREQRGALRKQAFGFNIPAITLFDRDKKPGDDDRLSAKIESASQDSQGHWIIRLEGGAVWIQTDDGVLGRDPKAGSTAVIHRGALGSFFMDFDGRPGFRAARRN
jgi:hypothetical protein